MTNQITPYPSVPSQVVAEVKFPKFINNLGIIPTSYKDSMNYYETLAWLCKFLEEQVIPTVNENGEAVEELQGLYVELNSYVTNYFANLDVQEEINNKLDDMVENGTINNVLSNYFNLLETTYTERYNQIETDVNNRIDIIDNKVDSATSGSPAGVYSTVAALTANNPDHSKIYLVTANGHWYYYNNTSHEWADGGTYQSTGIADKTITLPKLADDVKENLNQRTINFFNILGNKENEITLDLTQLNFENKSISPNTGARSSSDVHISNDYFVFLPKNSIIKVTNSIATANNYSLAIAYYTKDFEFIKRTDALPISNVQPFYCYTSDCYIRFQIANTSGVTSSILSDITIKIQETTNLYNMRYETGENILNYNNHIENCFVARAGGTTGISLNSSESYNTAYPLLLEVGKTYQFKNYRIICIVTDVKNILEYNANYEINEYTPAQPCYLIMSYAKENTPMVVVSDDPVEGTIEYYKKLPSDVQIDASNINIENTSNVLYNKKYVALGDSFTHGDFSTAPEDNYHITEGRYSGYYKVYPYIIGNRNNMNVINLAQNGMTLTNVKPNNYLSDTVLANIPSDVDYITIKIGINDNPDHQNAQLGTIDSTDSSKFYGSFNRVMTYLINNYKNAKIGIIVSNGQISEDFVNATINIAKKYGVAYLNESTDDRVPLLIRTLRSDVDSSIKTIRNTEWSVSSTNAHPSAPCHEYESTIVENFLRSL